MWERSILRGIGDAIDPVGAIWRDHCARITAERDRYKTALERIAEESFEHNGNDHVLALNQIAIHALEYKEDE